MEFGDFTGRLEAVKRHIGCDAQAATVPLQFDLRVRGDSTDHVERDVSPALFNYSQCLQEERQTLVRFDRPYEQNRLGRSRSPIVTEVNGVHGFVDGEDSGVRIQTAHKAGVELRAAGKETPYPNGVLFVMAYEAKTKIGVGLENLTDHTLDGH